MLVSAYPLPDRNESVAYAPNDVQAIGLALSDSNVTSLMAGTPYYPGSSALPGMRRPPAATSSSSTRLTAQGSSWPSDLDLDSVVGSFFRQRGFGECWPGGIFITDPWGETGFGCTL
jgi:hypothetical protein